MFRSMPKGSRMSSSQPVSLRHAAPGELSAERHPPKASWLGKWIRPLKKDKDEIEKNRLVY